MFAGKSTALIAELEESLESGAVNYVVKPSIDTRYDDTDIVSHDGTSLQKTTGLTVFRLGVDEIVPTELLLSKEVDLLLIDEAQFFSSNLCETAVQDYLRNGIDVVAVGLDLDSEGVPFGSMPTLLAYATKAYKLSSVCSVCGSEATRTFRKLSAKSHSQVLIGGTDHYEPRCYEHWLRGQKEKLSFLLSE